MMAKRFKVFTDMNKDPRNYCVVDIPHGTVIASGLSWVSATFICDALNGKQDRMIQMSEGQEGQEG